MHLLREGGEEAAISPETPLVGAFHVSGIDLRLRAVPCAAPVPLVSVRRFGFRGPLRFPCGEGGGLGLRPACGALLRYSMWFRSAGKNNPCIFLPKKKKQKASDPWRGRRAVGFGLPWFRLSIL